VIADVAIDADTTAAIGNLDEKTGGTEIDATGLAVAPGFINMLSWATESLIADGRSQSDIRQGVTLEIFGEGTSMGPLNEKMKEEEKNAQGDHTYNIPWTTLDEYLEHLVEQGVVPNVASFVGATTVRIHELRYEDRAPNPDELERMKNLVREAMEDGAMGIGSSLIYTPAFYADTDELIALVEVVAEYGGMHISHIRNESNTLLESLDELIHIARSTGAPSEIYHMKAAGTANWPKMLSMIEKVNEARAEGLAITADMYTYTAGSTGLNAGMPPWVQEGGFEAWRTRLQDPAIRARLVEEMRTPTNDWENLLLAAGPDNVLLVGFRKENLRNLIGKTLAEVAIERNKTPEETAMDLVVEDSSRVTTVYFLMSEENVQTGIAQPWVSFGSDAGSLAAEGHFLNASPHPRAYGNFARLLGKYVREEQIIPLEEAIRRLTSFPAANLKLKRRGLIQESYFADIVVFDPDTIRDHATFEKPHQYATGMKHVFVNGKQVLRDGEVTGALPGRVIRGPGWRGWTE